jgi:hypothetical protein
MTSTESQMPSGIEICPGQVWRRKSDGVETRIVSVDIPGLGVRRVEHQENRRRFATVYDTFLSTYEYVRKSSLNGRPESA